MGAFDASSKWLTFSITLAVATISASAAISVHFWGRKTIHTNEKIRKLELSLKGSLEKCAAERQGRIRAQQALRKSLTQPSSDNSEFTSYPMIPIAIVRSCFSTRNGTPRQPLLVPLARACLVFDSSRVPPASLEGLEDYSHCWILYVFHLNTDLEKLWKHPSKSKFKAKVRVPRLKGGRMGVFATRSPHRLCPIGLTVAKVDSLLDVASVTFSEGFPSALADCRKIVGKKSLYASPDEFQSLVKQVLSWDIRSVSQRSRPHNSLVKTEDGETVDHALDLDNYPDEASDNGFEQVSSFLSGDIIYHLILEGLDVSYRVDSDGHVLVEEVTLSSHQPNSNK
ncbi:uncharacterized protein LOC132278400 isoform X3 [Cornus florida]|uniref:uncharacterized protein LOC132278400 isoform X3 n=1 Tax=Cornus florida TaxID=4283 RepID=UPI00289AABC1|nr:uncharacterized protein LOC132278400 isoform X3 [Cornus florida]